MKKYFLLWAWCILPSLFATDFDLKSFIREKRLAGEHEIVLPDGEIRIVGTITLGPETKDLTIRGGKDTTIICTKLTPTFFLNGCDRVTLRDFTIDYDPLPFTQATITSIDKEKKTIRYQIHAGYPRLKPEYLVKHPLYFNSKTRLMSYDTKLSYCKGNRMLSESEGEIELTDNRGDLQVGDFVVLNNRVDSALKVRNMSDSLQFINLTIYSAPGLGIVSRQTRGVHVVRGCRMVRGPRPQGADQDRLLSLGADGVNYASSREGILIEDNEFCFLGDDSINLHGVTYLVARKEPERNAFLCVTTADYSQVIKPGDQVRLLAKKNYTIVGTATIKSVTKIDENLTDIDPKLIYPPKPPKTWITMRFEVEGELPEPGMRVDFPAINMPGFIIRNNYFHDHRARGMRIMACNGTIENNRIERMEHQAISIGPEYSHWGEAGWVNNIQIRNNQIKSVCLGPGCYRTVSYSLGAICTFVHNDNGSHGFFPGNQNITIENNEISDCSVAGIFLLATDGALVRGNRIFKVNWGDTSEAGKTFGITYRKEPIGQFSSKNVVIEKNEVKP